jgi:hypothetical protein
VDAGVLHESTGECQERRPWNRPICWLVICLNRCQPGFKSILAFTGSVAPEIVTLAFVATVGRTSFVAFERQHFILHLLRASEGAPRFTLLAHNSEESWFPEVQECLGVITKAAEGNRTLISSLGRRPQALFASLQNTRKPDNRSVLRHFVHCNALHSDASNISCYHSEVGSRFGIDEMMRSAFRRFVVLSLDVFCYWWQLLEFLASRFSIDPTA